MSFDNSSILQSLETLILEHDVLLNEKIEGGYTALAISILQEDYELFSILLNAGADISVCTDNNASLLFLCVQKENVQMVSELLKRNVDTQVKFKEKYTPFQLAKSKKNKEIYDLLKQHENNL